MLPSFVPAPHPVIVTHHTSSGGSGGDAPTSFVIGYAVVALLVWVGTALLLARHPDESGHPAFEPGEAVVGGFLAAVVWPLSAVAACVWWLVTLATRTKPRRP